MRNHRERNKTRKGGKRVHKHTRRTADKALKAEMLKALYEAGSMSIEEIQGRVRKELDKATRYGDYTEYDAARRVYESIVRPGNELG